MAGIITIPFHIGDFLSGTTHMDTLEKGAYVMLLISHYQAGEIGLPNDDKQLARMAGVSLKIWNRIRTVILQKFDLADGRYTQKVCLDVLLRVHDKSSAQRAKALKKHNTTHATAQPRHSQPKPKPKPLDDDDRESSRIYVLVGQKIASLTGWDRSPNWFGNHSHVEVWLNNGFDPELDIYPTVEKIVSKGIIPKTLNYFDQPIAQAFANRTRPITIPEGKSNGRKSHQQIAQEWAAKQDSDNL